MNSLVSVIIPTYNCGAYLPDAVNSVLSQEYSNLEILIVDDGSTDNTPEILDRLVRLDQRVRVFSLNTCSGPAAARNAGLSAARGSFVAFIDADDVWMPEKLRLQIEALDSDQKAGWACCNALMVDKELKAIRACDSDSARLTVTYEDIALRRLWVIPSAVLIRKDVLARCGRFNPDMRYAEDMELFLRLALIGPCTYTAKPLFKYRVHGSNGSVQLASVEPYRVMLLDQMIEKHPELEPVLRFAFYKEFGTRWLVSGNHGKARSHIVKALHHRPLALTCWIVLLMAVLPPSVLEAALACKRYCSKRP